jgi:hypothetical protein
LIRDSWQKSGYIPLDTLVILSKCSLWDGSGTFSAEQKRALIDGIPQLYPFVELRGRVSDREMETLFPFLPPLEKTAVHDLAQLLNGRGNASFRVVRLLQHLQKCISTIGPCTLPRQKWTQDIQEAQD